MAFQGGGFGAGGYGAAPGAGGFGAPAAGGFGAAAGAAGFGAPAAGGFGAAGGAGFGVAAAGGGFGSPGAFGAPAPAAGGFGAAGGYATPGAPAGYGAPAAAAGGFGAAAAGGFGAPAAGGFGAPAAGGGGGLWGGQPAAAAGGFGVNPTSPVQQAGFGAGGFGGGAAAGGFGAGAGGFGAGAGGFGAAGAPPGGYNYTPTSDHNNLQAGAKGPPLSILSISAMDQFRQQNLSHEEIRIADMARGGVGAGAAQPAAGYQQQHQQPGFGAPAQGGGLFGAGSPAAAGGFGGAPGFGAPAAQPGFGAPAAQPGFGAPAAQPGFGAPAAQPGFGAPAQGGGLFGAGSPAAAGGFGAPAAGGGLFGAAAPAAPGFGAPAGGGGLFGAAAPAAPGFGAPAAGGGLFGAAAPAAPGFGAPAAGGGLFGAPASSAAAGAGLFGAPAASGAGLFGAPAAGGDLFGAAAPAAPGFGAPAAGGGLFGAAAPAAGGGLFGAPAAPVAAAAQAQNNQAPEPISDKDDYVVATGMYGQRSWSTYQENKASVDEQGGANEHGGSDDMPPSALRRSIRKDPRERLRGSSYGGVHHAPVLSSYRGTTTSVGSGRGSSMGSYVSRTGVRTPLQVRGQQQQQQQQSMLNSLSSQQPTPRSGTRLVLKLRSQTPQRSRGGGIGNTSAMMTVSAATSSKSATGKKLSSGGGGGGKYNSAGSPSPIPTNGSSASPYLQQQQGGQASPATDAAGNIKPVPLAPTVQGTGKSQMSETLADVTFGAGANKKIVFEEGQNLRGFHNGYVITLTDEHGCPESDNGVLARMQGDELKRLKGLKVEHPDFGSVEWDGTENAINLSNGFDFNLISISDDGAEVYPDGYEPYPDQGKELNIPATITLYKVQVSGKTAESREKKIKKRCSNLKDVTYVSFTEHDKPGLSDDLRAKCPIWKFKVMHFTKYNYDDVDSSDDEDDDATGNDMDMTGAVGGPLEFNPPAAITVSKAAAAAAVEAGAATPRGRVGVGDAMDQSSEDDEDNSDTPVASDPSVDLPHGDGVESEDEDDMEMTNAVGGFVGMQQQQQQQHPRGGDDGFRPASMVVRAARSGARTAVGNRSALVLTTATPTLRPIAPQTAKVHGTGDYRTPEQSSLERDALRDMGRSFRVGWGPNGVLYCPAAGRTQGVKKHQASGGAQVYASPGGQWSVSKHAVNIGTAVTSPDAGSDSEHKDLLAGYRALFPSRGKYGNSGGDGDDGTARLNAVMLAKAHATHFGNDGGRPEDEKDVAAWKLWKLVDALYGAPEQNDKQSITAALEQLESFCASSADGMMDMFRRELLSRWLSECGDHVVSVVRAGQQDGFMDVFYLLCKNDIIGAARKARETKNYRLAALVAQTVGDPERQADVQAQLKEWEVEGGTGMVNGDAFKVYALLAGEFSAVGLAPANPMHLEEGGPRAHVCDGLDWTRAFALYLWYKSNASNPSVRPSVDESLQEFNAYVSSRAARLDADYVVDSSYNLLQIYAGGSGRGAEEKAVHEALLPTSHGRTEQDYRVSWFLCQVLHDLGKLGDDGKSAAFRDGLHTDYAAQLEAAGYWGDAVYILLHLSIEDAQQTAIRELLRRNYSKVMAQPDTATAYNLPQEWLHEAAALGFRYAQDREAEVDALVKAHELGQAHVVIHESVAHEHVIGVKRQDGTKDVMSWLTAVERARDEDGGVEKWERKGKVFLDYFRIMESSLPFRDKVASNASLGRSGQDGGYDQDAENMIPDEIPDEVLESLKKDAKEWCNLQLECDTDIDRVCDATMRREVFQLLETLHDHVESPDSTYELAKELSGTGAQDIQIAENYRMGQLQRWTAEMTATLGI